jgi:S-adenosylmethionine decarboxylase
MDRLGKHLIIELFDCDSRIISDLNAVEKHLLEAVRLSGATIVRSFFHLFPPDGVSGIVVVAESHFSIHTWPEHGYSALDIFTCGDRIQSQKALNYLKKYFKPKDSATLELQRGPSGPALIQNTDSDSRERFRT